MAAGRGTWIRKLVLALALVALGSLPVFAQLPPTAEERPGTLCVASWNVCNLSQKTDVRLRAEVIARAGFDLVAIQEVERPEGLENLRGAVQERTGVTWEKLCSDEVGTGGAAEFYGFLWRSDRVRLAEGPRGHYPASPGQFARTPFFATFKAGQFDFTWAELHATFGTKMSERVAELALVPAVIEHVQQADPNEDDVIFSGDFNVDQRHKSWQGVRDAGLTCLLNGVPGTTYGTTGRSVFASAYDQMLLDGRYTTEYTGTNGVVYLHELWGQDATVPHLAVRTAVSDHCPIWAIFDTTRDDDGPRFASLPVAEPGPSAADWGELASGSGSSDWGEASAASFVGNAKTKVVHATTCRYAAGLAADGVPFASAADAAASGYRACDRCGKAR